MEHHADDKLIGQLREQVNNLLAAVQLFTPLVREKGTDRDREYLAVMNQSLYRLLRTISHMELDRAEPPLSGPGRWTWRGSAWNWAGWWGTWPPTWGWISAANWRRRAS